MDEILSDQKGEIETEDVLDLDDNNGNGLLFDEDQIQWLIYKKINTFLIVPSKNWNYSTNLL